MARPLSDAKEAIIKSPADSSVYVGCDSIRFRRNGEWYARYATVVILHHSSRMGGSIFFDTQILRDYDNTKVRLFNEVMFATQAGLDIMDVLDGRYMELHLDVNPNPRYKSNIIMDEAIGYVMGNLGIKPKIKPDSWASSHCADHCVRMKIK